MIYGMVLRNKRARAFTGTSLQLTGTMTAEAKALSQVSRAVRADSMSIYYSENTFYAHLSQDWNVSGPIRARCRINEVARDEEWSIIFGELVAPRLHSLRIELARDYWLTHHIGSIDFKEPFQSLTRTAKPWKGFNMSEASKAELEAFTLAVLRPRGEIVRTATTLRLFLLGLQVITEQHSNRMPEELPATARLYLESRTELEKYLPHIQLSPEEVIFDFT